MSITQWHKFHMLNDCLEFYLKCVMSHLVQSRAGPCVRVCVHVCVLVCVCVCACVCVSVCVCV